MTTKATIEELVGAMGEYPPHVSFRFGTEETPDGKIYYLSIYEAAPPDGWSSLGAHLRSAPGAIHWRLPVHPADEHEAAVRVGVTALDEEALARLGLRMVREHARRFDCYPPTEDASPPTEDASPPTDNLVAGGETAYRGSGRVACPHETASYVRVGEECGLCGRTMAAPQRRP